MSAVLIGPFKEIILSLFTFGLPFWFYPIIKDGVNLSLLSGVRNDFIRMFLAFLALDFLYFLRHYTLHYFDFLWHFHKIHHSPQSLNILMHWRTHPVASVFKKTMILPFAAILGLNREEFVLLFLVRECWVILHHSSLNISLGPLNYIFITPEFHRHHHTIRETGKRHLNLGNVFTFWDLLFSTACFEDLSDHVPLGIKEEWTRKPNLKDQFFRPYSDAVRSLKSD